MAHRQKSDIVEAVVQQFIGVKGRDVPRRQAPEHAMHSIARAWRHRAPAIYADEKAMAFENGVADRVRTRTAALHRRAMHVGPIGEIEHQTGIPDLWLPCQRERYAWSSRSISRS